MHFRFLAALALVASAGAFAQDHMRMRQGPPAGGPGPGEFAFVRPEFGLAGKVVKSAPYSAQVVTQSTQTLADGNRIQRTSTISFARDSEGRTRTEQSVAAMGPLSSSTNSAAKAVFIHDPVGGVSYMLDVNKRTAHQMTIRNHGGQDSAAGQPAGHGPRGGGDSSQAMARRQERQAEMKTEDLGTQVMDGVSVQGKRVTRTIPAGQFGNEKAMDIVTESWYSAELQTVVMRRTTDPRMGESIFKLTNITRAEPDHSLFVVPSDYSVTQAPAHGRGPQGPSSNQ